MNLRGEIVSACPRIMRDADSHELRYLLYPYISPLLPAPPVLIASHVTRAIAAMALHAHAEPNPNLETLPCAWNYQARVGRSWQRIFCASSGLTERQYVEHACQITGLFVDSSESIARLMQRLVSHLAACPPVEYEGNRQE